MCDTLSISIESVESMQGCSTSDSKSTTEIESVSEPEQDQPVKRWWESIELRSDSITGQKMKSMQGVIPSFMNGRDINLQPGATIYAPTECPTEKKNNRKASKKRRQGRKKDRTPTASRRSNNSTKTDNSEISWKDEVSETTYGLEMMLEIW